MLWHGKNFRGFLHHALQVIFDNTGTTLSSTNVEDAIKEVNSNKADKANVLTNLKGTLKKVTYGDQTFTSGNSYSATDFGLGFVYAVILSPQFVSNYAVCPMVTLSNDRRSFTVTIKYVNDSEYGSTNVSCSYIIIGE